MCQTKMVKLRTAGFGFFALLELCVASPAIVTRQTSASNSTCTEKAQRKAWYATK